MKITPPPGIAVPPELLERGVDAVETHLSWVLLTDHFVYKWKKPIKLPFVDFTTRVNRLTAAASELELNRRLAPSIYLGLGSVETVNGKARWGSASVRNASDWLAVAGVDGEPVVAMKRIPKDAFLDCQLVAGKVHETLLKELARLLADFHKSTRTASSDSTPLIEVARLNAIDNFSALRQNEVNLLLGSEARVPLERTFRWTEDEFKRIRNLLLERTGTLGKSKCFLADGHGDLRLEHVAILPGAKPDIQIIDCVEFSDDLRRTDQGADLGFLAMDLEFNHRPDLAELLESNYSSLAQDAALCELMPWFKTYRAMVRAKVHALRAGQYAQGKVAVLAQEQVDLARRYLALACRNTFEIKRFPLIVVCGLSGTGKSTVARELSGFLDALILNSDVIRKEKIEDRPKDAAYGLGSYSVEGRLAIYDQMFERTATYLRQGNPVILDATFPSQALRARANALAQAAMIPCVVIECRLSRAEAIERLQRRQQKGGSVSDAGPNVYEEQLKTWELIQSSEQFRHFILRTEGGARGAIGNAISLLEPCFLN